MSAEPRPDPVARSGEPSQRVELSIPARPDMVVLARLAAAAIASRADFGVDQVEDLRLAIDEICITLVGEGLSGQLALAFEWTGDTITVTGRRRSSDAGAVGRSSRNGGSPGYEPGGSMRTELSERILDALVDEHGSDTAGPEPCMWFSVRKSGAR